MMSVRFLSIALATILLMGGCAGEMAFREGRSLLSAGKTDEGLVKLDEASRADPENLTYRLQLQGAKELAANRLIKAAQAELQVGHYDEADSLFSKAEGLQPDNAQISAYRNSMPSMRRQDVLLAEVPALIESGQIELADQMISQVLLENPRQREAQELRRRINEKGGRDHVVSPSLNKVYRKRISLELRDANLKQLVESLSRNSGLNFVLDKDILPNLVTTLFLRDVTVEEAIDVILRTHQLEKRVLNDTTLLIFPSTTAKLQEHQELVVRSFYLANSSAKSVMEMLKTVLKLKSVYVDEKRNLLVIRDTADAIRLSEQLVAQQDIPEPEVMLEVEVLEVKRTALTNLGIQFPDQLTLTPLAKNGTAVTLADIRSINSGHTGATLSNTVVNAHRDTDDSNILANPRIRTRNHEKAEIKIGDRLPIVTTTTVSTGFVSESVQYVDVGLKLEVEPTVFPDNQVEIKMSLEVSSVVGNITSKAGSTYYQIGGRNASTVLRLKDGETQILGGLISKQDDSTANRVPGLGDLPILGRLFSSHRDNAQKTELVLSITPHLIRGIVPPQGVPKEFWSGTENTLRVKALNTRQANSEANTPEDVPLSGRLPIRQPEILGTGTPTDATVPTKQAAVQLKWSEMPPVKVGEIFTATLGISTERALTGFPLQIRYDPSVIEVETVEDGGFLTQDGLSATFAQKVVPAAGYIFTSDNRDIAVGVTGSGKLITIHGKALKPVKASQLTVFPTSPSASDSGPTVSIPVTTLSITIVP